MRLDRKKILDDIGFVWKADFDPTGVKQWDQRDKKLVEFKRKHGNCMAPQSYEQDKPVGMWVAKQRSYHNDDKLRPDRKRLLDEIGFTWKFDLDAYDDNLWHQQHVKLVEFQRKQGNCVVPSRYEQDKFLGQWVSRQRTLHKRNRLRPGRKELLDALDFVWNGNAPGVRSCSTITRKRTSACLAESGQMVAKANQRSKASGSSSSVVDSTLSLLTSAGARIGSYQGQEEVAPEQATTIGEIPCGWTRVKLEPDC
jgi:hypothetical protein